MNRRIVGLFAVAIAVGAVTEVALDGGLAWTPEAENRCATEDPHRATASEFRKCIVEGLPLKIQP